MADISDINASLPVKIVGANSTGLETNPVDATVNGLKVDGSAVTQPISAASLPLPTGAATEITLSAIGLTQTNGNQQAKILDALGNGITSAITAPLQTDRGLVVRPLPFERQTFSVQASDITIGNGKSMLSLFNAGGSSVVIRLQSLKIYNVRTTAITGVMANFGLRKISTHSGGTQLTTTGSASGLIFPFDSTNSLNGSVTARTGATVTDAPAFDIMRWLWSSDEFGPGTADAETFEHTIAQTTLAWEAKLNSQPITLRAGEGIHVRQATNSTNGTFDLLLIFTQDTV